MLARNRYPAAYVVECRQRMTAQLDAFRALAAGVAKTGAARKALDAFTLPFLHHLIVALDAYAMHRMRAMEGKDGNALNEVRMLAVSILENDAVLRADNTIKYKPEASVLGLRIGDVIVVGEPGMRALADAFFDELERKFT